VADGVRAEARDHLWRAADEMRALDLPTVEVLVNLRAAAVEDRTAAAGRLRVADRIARRLRSRLLRGRVAAEMAGLHLVISPDREASGLTPREAEVMQLVGAGHTSREIAERLRLSVRTVEMHVGNVVATLGCRTRAEAARRLAELGA
jgi:DNA-binding NarL/FixJ family response regulator